MKEREIRNNREHDAIEVVNIEGTTDDIIATEWIFIERKGQDGSKIVEARLSLVGEVGELLKKIRKKNSNIQQQISQNFALYCSQSRLENKSSQLRESTLTIGSNSTRNFSKTSGRKQPSNK